MLGTVRVFCKKVAYLLSHGTQLARHVCFSRSHLCARNINCMSRDVKLILVLFSLHSAMVFKKHVCLLTSPHSPASCFFTIHTLLPYLFSLLLLFYCPLPLLPFMISEDKNIQGNGERHIANRAKFPKCWIWDTSLGINAFSSANFFIIVLVPICSKDF